MSPLHEPGRGAGFHAGPEIRDRDGTDPSRAVPGRKARTSPSEDSRSETLPARTGAETRRRRLGITLGDVTGVGPEVTVKALARPPADTAATYVVIGDAGRLRGARDRWAPGLEIAIWPSEDPGARVQVWQPTADALPPDLPPGSPAAAGAALGWVRAGAQACLAKTLDGLVTAPVNKAAIMRAGHDFVGQTEYLAGLAGVREPAMMLLGTDARGRWLRVALVTTHVRLRDVAARITEAAVLRTIQLAAQACERLHLERRRVVVCGLNPHAGEGGEIGDEESRIIEPAVRRGREEGLDVVGPLAADTVFHQAVDGAYDAVVAMYHDQGLAPLKLVAFETGVNWTLGLPFVRTSPDHGTAYDIAGQGVASCSSMTAALTLAGRLAGA